MDYTTINNEKPTAEQWKAWYEHKSNKEQVLDGIEIILDRLNEIETAIEDVNRK